MICHDIYGKNMWKVFHKYAEENDKTLYIVTYNMLS